MKLHAVISDCGRYRYELRRTWDASRPSVLFIGLNPSTADASSEDNTSRVCINYAKRWGFGSLLLGNLFAYRSTDPAMLREVADPVGPDNDAWLARLAREAGLVVCAWGNAGALNARDRSVLALIDDPHCLSRLKSGRPGHPLYKPANLRPMALY